MIIFYVFWGALLNLSALSNLLFIKLVYKIWHSMSTHQLQVGLHAREQAGVTGFHDAMYKGLWDSSMGGYMNRRIISTAQSDPAARLMLVKYAML